MRASSSCGQIPERRANVTNRQLTRPETNTVSRARTLICSMTLVLAACASSSSTPGGEVAPTVPPPPTWTLVWSDEFDGAAGSPFDATKWGAELGGNGWGNQEREYYTTRPEN